MTTHALPHRLDRPRLVVAPATKQWLWLAGGFILAFLIPFSQTLSSSTGTCTKGCTPPASGCAGPRY
jgi:hypothetical protein